MRRVLRVLAWFVGAGAVALCCHTWGWHPLLAVPLVAESVLLTGLRYYWFGGGDGTYWDAVWDSLTGDEGGDGDWDDWS